MSFSPTVDKTILGQRPKLLRKVAAGILTLYSSASGKRLRIFFGPQTLANGAYLWDEPGIFVAFRRPPSNLANAAGYGGNLIEPNTSVF